MLRAMGVASNKSQAFDRAGGWSGCIRCDMSATNLLRIRDVAARLDVSIETVRRLRANGVLPAVKIGTKCVRFTPEAVDELMENGSQPDSLPSVATNT